MAGTLTITGLAAGLATGQKTVGPLTLTGGAVIGEIRDLTLATGDTTVPVPAGAVAALIALPSSNVAALTLRTNLNSGDSGLPLGPTGWAVIPFAAGVSALIVHASASATAEATFI
jgi:hypothetical protein